MGDEQSSPAESIADYFGLSNMPADGADLSKVEKFAAAIDSANYLNNEMAGCARYASGRELLAAGLAASGAVPGGLVLEFGVARAVTINFIANRTQATVYGFDSFKGLPEDWRVDFKKGAFRRSDLPDVNPNVELVVGWFDETLPEFVLSHPGPVSFLHVDCDLYSSTKTVLDHLEPRILPGAVIVFDEYFNYVGWRAHEWKAFREFIARSGRTYRYFGAAPTHQQVGVVITG